MGIFRKTMSVSSLGMVSYRSQNERANRIAKQTRNAARAQVAQQAFNLQIQREQQAQLAYLNAQIAARRIEAQLPQAHPSLHFQAAANSASPPPGWYQNPEGNGLRWWDGARWTEHFHS